jgi:hypothetical protein
MSDSKDDQEKALLVDGTFGLLKQASSQEGRRWEMEK